MKNYSLLLLSLLGLSACHRSEMRSSSADSGAQMVSLVVRSEPSGARLRVNNLSRTWTTPADVADFSLTKGLIDLELSLEGYESWKTQVRYDGTDPVHVHARLIS